MFYLFNKSRFIGVKLCKPTEKHNITILHEGVVDFEVF